MTPIRWLIVSFWVFIVCMLIWQAYTYEINSEKEIAAHPEPQHFFFDPSRDQKPTVNPNLHAASVKQTAYWVIDEPAMGRFTSHVVLTNQGNAKAVGIQIWIRPYRGISVGGSRNGDGGLPRKLSENDPISLMGQWINAPDLAPNESCTQTLAFVTRPEVKPGSNPNPQIIFETEKPNP